jgi:hypothetical protein
VPSDARSIFYYYFGAIWQPRAAFDALLKDERRLKFSLIALLITTQLYTLVHILLGFADMGGAHVRPWVDIPVASYFHFEELFATPSIFVGSLLAAGLAQLLTRLVDGKGTFEDMLSVLGVGISVASLPVLLLDVPQSALSAFGILDPKRLATLARTPGAWHEIMMFLYALSVTWTAALFCIGVRSVQAVRFSAAVVVGLLSYLAYAGVFAFINR